MAITALLITATKIAGVLASLTFAANGLSYSLFRKKNLRSFQSPIDESSDILADFSVNSSDGEPEFFFGLATAPAHVEDRLDDAWLQFASETPPETSGSTEEPQTADNISASAAGDGGSQQPVSGEAKKSLKKKKNLKIAMEAMIRGFQKFTEEDAEEEEEGIPIGSQNVAAWHNVPHPEERLRFWSDPDTELNLAKNTGITVFRMGVDWSRIMPKEPTGELNEAVNFAALERYKWIIHRVRSYGMKVMLTLFHHSLPSWAGEYGGWKLEKTVDYFLMFTRLLLSIPPSTIKVDGH